MVSPKESPQFHDSEKWESLSPVEKMLAYAQWVSEISFIRAYERLRKEMHNEACGCKSCLNLVVNELNSWREFMDLEGDYEGMDYTVEVDEGGNLFIQPPQPTPSQGDKNYSGSRG